MPAKLFTVLLVLAVPGVAHAWPHHHRLCRETERTLGRRTCGRFGDWSTATRIPPLSMGWLALARSRPPLATSSSIARGKLSPERGDAAPMVGPGLRFTIGGTWYAGFEVSVGFAGAPRYPAFGAVHAVLGARAWLERSTLSLEIAPGGLVVTSSEATETATRGAIELRVRADRWLSPWFTIGGFAGVDPFAREVSAGVSFAYHARAFDGGRP
jgi:hypothetical protein